MELEYDVSTSRRELALLEAQLAQALATAVEREGQARNARDEVVKVAEYFATEITKEETRLATEAEDRVKAAEDAATRAEAALEIARTETTRLRTAAEAENIKKIALEETAQTSLREELNKLETATAAEAGRFIVEANSAIAAERDAIEVAEAAGNTMESTPLALGGAFLAADIFLCDQLHFSQPFAIVGGILAAGALFTFGSANEDLLAPKKKEAP